MGYINKKCNSKSLSNAEYMNESNKKEISEINIDIDEHDKNEINKYKKSNEKEISEINIDIDEHDKNEINKTNEKEKNLLNTNTSQNILDIDIPFIKEKFTIQKNTSEKIINKIVNGIEWSSLRNTFKNKDNHSIIASKIFSH